ncbi:hypothetical protein [Paraburkholderia terrae]
MLGKHRRRVTAQLAGTKMCADYCEETGRLRILCGHVVIREWLRPNSWMAIASVVGVHNWGTRPDQNDLCMLLESEVSMMDDV